MPRYKNIPNKNKKFLMNRLKDMFGDDFDPIMKASQHALEMEKIASGVDMAKEEPEKRLKAHKDCLDGWDKIAQYIEPKLKAVEVEISGEIEVNEANDAERAARVAAIFDEARGRRTRQLDS